ncbi:MAG: phage tail tape measure protein [Thermomicrobiales bacterium]
MDGGGAGASLGAARGEISLDAKGALSALDQVSAGLRNLDSSAGSATGIQGWAARNQQSIRAVGLGMVGFGTAVVGGFGIAVKSAATFEQTMSGVQAVLGPEQFAQFGGQLKDLALTLGKDTVFSANEAGQAIEELGKQGISATDILGGAAKSVTSLASATGTDLATSATITANAMNQFAIQGKDAGSVADILTNGANASSASVSSLGEGLTYVGGTAHALHIPLTDTVTALAELADNGMAGSMGGTALNDVLLRLVSPVGKAKKAMDGLGLSVGQANSVFEADGQTLKPLGEVITAVTKATTGMGDAQKQSYLKTVFGIEGARAMNALLSGQEKQLAGTGKGWSDYAAEIGKTGTADAQAKIRLDNLKGSLEQLKGSIETAAITIGSVLLPALRTVVDFLTTVVNAFLELPSGIQTAIAAFTGIAGVLSLVGGGFLLLLPKILAIKNALSVMSAAGSFSGLAALVPILLGVAAAIGVFYLAYKTNFLGFGDAVDGAISGVRNFVNKLTSTFDELTRAGTDTTIMFGAFALHIKRAGESMNPVVAIFYAIAAALRSIGGGNIGFLNTLADGFDAVGNAAQGVIRFIDRFRKAYNDLVHPIQKSTIMFGDFAAHVEKAGKGIDKVTGFFKAFSSALRQVGGGNIKIFQQLADVVDSVGKAVRAGITFVNTLRTAYDNLRNTLNPVSAALGALQSALTQLGITYPALGSAINAVNTVLGVARDAVDKFTNAFILGRTLGLNPFQSVLLGLGVAIPALQPVLNVVTQTVGHLTDAFDAFKKGDYSQGFRDLGSAIQDIGSSLKSGAIQLGSLAVSIGGWVVSSAVDLGKSVLNWITGTAIPAISKAAQTIGSWAVTIGGWLVTAAKNLGTAVLDWITGTAIPAISKTAQTIASWAIKIGGWLITAAKNLGTAVLDWITGTAIPAITKTAQTIESWAIKIGGWLITAAKNLGTAVLDWITGTAIPTITKTAQTIESWAIKIGGWLVTAAKNLGTAVLDWITGTAIPAITTTAQNIGDYAVTIGKWIVTAAENLGTAVKSWVIGTALPLLGTAGQNIGNFAVQIAGWVVSALTNLGIAVKSWVIGTALPALGTAGQNIGNVAVAIAGWLVSALQNLGVAVRSWVIGTALPALGTAGQNIGNIAVQIAGWLVSTLSNLGIAVKGWIVGTALPTIGNVAQDIGSIAVQIGDWLVSAAQNIGSKISTFIDGLLPTVHAIVKDVGSIATKISDYTVDHGTALAGKINAAVDSAYNDYVAQGVAPKQIGPIKLEVKDYEVDGNPGALQSAVDAGAGPDSPAWTQVYGGGFKIGFVGVQRLVDKINEGIKSFGEGLTGGSGGFNESFIGIGAKMAVGGAIGLVGGFDGALTAASNAMRSIPANFYTSIIEPIGAGIARQASEGFNNMFGASSPPVQFLKRAIDGMKVAFQQTFDGIKVKAPNILKWFGSWTMPGVDDIPGIATLKAFINLIPGIFNNFKWPAIKIPMPDINWPNPDDWIPQNIKDFFADPMGYIIKGGGGKSKGKSAQDIIDESFSDLPDPNLSNKKQGSGTSGFGGLSGLAGVKIPDVSGMFKTSGITTFIENLKTFGTQLATTAASMTAFNAGPLTLLNAGFPILAATILAFNSGPLTTLNAAFPILAATMTAFNSGPLTLLNAGFPILAATILAFNSGPLTTLNAAFPILSASMTAFNAGPLTLLNAGFPILAATILAFNAGPLTTLNAAFPILAASMTAFNAGPLTLLNAGFPILAATILAFNAGPLTTLNAAFPILAATMLAFNAGPLTLLNAGFPILAATIVTFVATTTAGMATWTAALTTALTTTGTNLATMGAAFVTGGAAISTFGSSSSASMSAWQSSVSASIQSVVQSITGTLANALSVGRSNFQSFASSAQSAASQVASSVASGMAQASGSVANESGRWAGIVASAGGAMAAAGFSAGAAAGQGVASGMNAMLGQVQAAASAIAATVQSALANKLRIASPSKVTTKLGIFTGQGFALGIRKMIPDVARASAALFAIPTMAQASGFGGAGASAYWSRIPASNSTSSSVTYNNSMQITQLPGEDGEALANRVVKALHQDYIDVNGLAR